MALGLFVHVEPPKKGDAFILVFWAQDFCKKSVLARGFFFRVSVFRFVTIYRLILFYESIMVSVFSPKIYHFARCIVIIYVKSSDL